ncbi:hypothetical protein ABZ626_38460 [Streptomyces longispororuber]|uniref:hypothetical protein n=1 Tax=Streptomyces longispororuber TaxID=68230 RepID=UPI0034034354
MPGVRDAVDAGCGASGGHGLLLAAWERVWISEKITQFRRMITGTLAPHLALFPHSRWANYLNTQVTAVEVTLEMAATQTR